MSRICEICGKKPSVGNTIVRRGLAKKKGGIGLHTTGINKRRFIPNLHNVRVAVNGGVRKMKLCAACIKSNKVLKG